MLSVHCAVKTVALWTTELNRYEEKNTTMPAARKKMKLCAAGMSTTISNVNSIAILVKNQVTVTMSRLMSSLIWTTWDFNDSLDGTTTQYTTAHNNTTTHNNTFVHLLLKYCIIPNTSNAYNKPIWLLSQRYQRSSSSLWFTRPSHHLVCWYNELCITTSEFHYQYP